MSPGQRTSWERVGDELLVLDADHATVHRFSGPAADIGLALLGDDLTDWDESDEVHVAVWDALAGVGLLRGERPSRSTDRRISRRTALGAGAALGITVLALPVAAAASSGPLPEGGGGESGGGDGGGDGDGALVAQSAFPSDGSVEVVGNDNF